MNHVLTTSNPRIARLQNYAFKYNKHKQDLTERKKKEEEQKKPKPFKARPLPKYLKAKKTESGDQTDGKDKKDTDRRPSSTPTSRASSQPRTLPPPTKPVLRARSASAAATVPSMVTRQKAKQIAAVAAVKSAPPVAKVKPNVKSAPKPPSKPVALKATHSTQSNKPLQSNKPVSAPVGEQNQRKFVAKVPTYLKKEPFKVKLAEKKAPVETKPFNLGMNSRLETRNKIEKDRRKALEQKNRQMLEEKRKREEEEFKAMRKQREFKAQTNPFSSKVTKNKVTENGVKERHGKNESA